VDRRFEIEQVRRSLVMLAPGHPSALGREDALRLVTELADLQARLERLRAGLGQLLEDTGGPA